MGRSASSAARTITTLAMLLIASIVAGILTAGLALPALGVVGVTARAGVSLFESLPGEMQVNPLAQSSKFLAKDGTVIAEPYAEDRIIVPISKMSKYMLQAQVAIEDERFYDHAGIDIRGTMRAFVKNSTSSSAQGGSTITQQYVKQQLLEGARRKGDSEELLQLSARSGLDGYVRKIRELKYAIALEKKYSKEQILQGYLNMVYFGDRTYGVEAASMHYFSVHAKDLSIDQAALLAGLVQSPSTTDPRNHAKRAKDRRDVVLYKMHQQGYITDAEYKKAKDTPIQLKLSKRASGGNCASAKGYEYFCDYVFKWLLEQPSLGKNPTERKNAVLRDGLTVYTTLDVKKAKEMGTAIRKHVPVADPSNLKGAGITVDPQNGNVIAMAQSTNYSLVTKPGGIALNYTTDFRYGGSSGFQFGSTAKYFAVMTAVEKGMTGSSTIDVPPLKVQPALQADGTPDPKAKAPVNVVTFRNELNVDKCNNAGGVWQVGNVEGKSHSGPQTLEYITQNSVNTAFVKLNSQLGFCKVRDTMIKLGMHQANQAETPITKTPSGITLGSDSVSPMTVASAFAVMAGNGKLCTPTPVVKILGPGNKNYAVPTAKDRCKQVVSPDIAYKTTQILTGVVTNYKASLTSGQPAAGKSGTSNLADSTWFAGVTPRYATAIWVGLQEPKKGGDALNDITVGGEHFDHIYSTSLAVPIWKDTMNAFTAGEPVVNFSVQAPTDAAATDDPSKPKDGAPTPLPDVRGMSETEAKAKLEAAGFTVADGVPYYSRVYDLGTVGRQTPAGGTTQPAGSTVTLDIVKGTSR